VKELEEKNYLKSEASEKKTGGKLNTGKKKDLTGKLGDSPLNGGAGKVKNWDSANLVPNWGGSVGGREN